MPTLSITKNYHDGTVLTEAHLDAALDSVSTFLNSTKIDNANIQTGGIATANYAGLSVDAAALAANAVTTAKILDANVTVAKLETASVGHSGTMNLGVTASVGSSALTLALKTQAGTDASSSSPIRLVFRSSTATTGVPVVRAITGALSLVVSSGSTLGTASGVTHYLYLYALDNAGTVELGVSQSLFDDGSIVSTTAEGGAGAADSAAVMYSTTARSNVACKLLARISSNQATAGTWASAPTEISLVPLTSLPRPIAVYAGASSTNITSGATTIIDFATKVEDTYNAVTIGASWKFTAPTAGVYRISCLVGAAASAGWSEGEVWRASLYKNGSVVRTIGEAVATAVHSTSTNAAGSTLVRLAATDYIDIRVTQNNGSTVGTVNASPEALWVAIEWVSP